MMTRLDGFLTFRKTRLYWSAKFYERKNEYGTYDPENLVIEDLTIDGTDVPYRIRHEIFDEIYQNIYERINE